MSFSRNKLSNVSSKNHKNISHNINRGYFVISFVAIIMIYAVYLSEQNNTQYLQKEQISSIIKQDLTYVLNTSECRIPDSSPYSEDIVDFIKIEKYTKCSTKHLLTYIDKSNGTVVTLRVNQSVLMEYSLLPINCCYSNITRINYEKKVDNEIKITDCTPFNESVEIRFPYIQVKCSTTFGIVYTNVHATTLPIPREVKKRRNKPEFSILLLGIDSMSKSNLRRTMTKTYNYAEKHMLGYKGYNKIGDNTFPNLMAILTGYDMSQLNQFCNRTTKINECGLIWDKFKDLGYVTAYAEDYCDISTYNYDRPGFLEEPTDFYYHAYFLAAEKLSTQWRGGMPYCAGPETSGERMLNAARDFVVTFKNVPSFGLFWSNSVSHDNVNMPAVMDEPLLNLLSGADFMSSLNNTILIFFSDHGFRFGKIRYTHTGWLEERLPFLYFLIPDTFKRAYPEKYNNLLINSDRLTTPYDLHNMFQDVLRSENASYTPTWSQGCPGCQSLFLEIAENRTCEAASINQHWCTCRGHNYINPNHPRVRLIAEFVISEINKLLQPIWSLCSEYSLKTIRTAGVSELHVNKKNESVNYFLVMVETEPKAIFEATVEDISDNRLRILGEISRINRYEHVSKCIKDNGFLRKYCYCAGLLEKIKKIFRNFR